MSNQKLTPQQKHVQYCLRWNEKNIEYFTKQNRLRSKKTQLKNAIPKMELKIIQYKLRIQLIDKQLYENSKSRLSTSNKQPKLETKPPPLKKKPSDSTICYICDIPYPTKLGLLKHNARRHGEPTPQ